MEMAGKVSNVTNLPKIQETLGAQGFLCGQVSGGPVQNGQDNALISRELWIDDSDSQAATLAITSPAGKYSRQYLSRRAEANCKYTFKVTGPSASKKQYGQFGGA
jgi:hypothetical protein